VPRFIVEVVRYVVLRGAIANVVLRVDEEQDYSADWRRAGLEVRVEPVPESFAALGPWRVSRDGTFELHVEEIRCGMETRLPFAVEVLVPGGRWSFDLWAPGFVARTIGGLGGIDVGLILNRVPVWAVDAGLTRVWCFAQDLFNFRTPWWPPRGAERSRGGGGWTE